MEWEKARDEWAKQKVREIRGPRLQADIEILDIDIDHGGSYQIGEYTWDYDNASVEIGYRTLGKKKKISSVKVELYDFGRLVREIVHVANGGKLETIS